MNEPYGASVMTLRSRRVGVNGTSIQEVFYAPYGPPPNVAYGASFIQTAGATERSVAPNLCSLTGFFDRDHAVSWQRYRRRCVLWSRILDSLAVAALMVLASVLLMKEREFSESKRPGRKLPFAAVRANGPVSPRSA